MNSNSNYLNCHEKMKRIKHKTTQTSTTSHYVIRDVMKSFCLPTVYALQAEQTNKADEISKLTTIDRLESARPQFAISENEVNEYIKCESGKDRVREMFSRNNSEYSNDLLLITQTTRNCSFAVFLVTSVFGANAAREKFIEKNKHTKYATKFQAFRAYNDTVVFGGLRFGIKWSFKSAFFTGLFMATAQTISVYRNQTSVMEYIAAGGLTCSLLRMNVGIRGMFAGGVIGSVLGLAAGTCLCGLMYATNSTQQQRRYSMVEQLLKEKREIEMFKQAPIKNLDGSMEGQAV